MASRKPNEAARMTKAAKDAEAKKQAELEATRTAQGLPAKISAPKPTRAGKSSPTAVSTMKRTPTARKTQRDRLAAADAKAASAPAAPTVEDLGAAAEALPMEKFKNGNLKPVSKAKKKAHVNDTAEKATVKLKQVGGIVREGESSKRQEKKAKNAIAKKYWQGSVTSTDPINEDETPAPVLRKPILVGTSEYDRFVGGNFAGGKPVKSQYQDHRQGMIHTLDKIENAIGHMGTALPPKHVSPEFQDTMYQYLQSARASHDNAWNLSANGRHLEAAGQLRDAQDTLNSMYHHIKTSLSGKQLLSGIPIAKKAGDSILGYINKHNSQVGKVLYEYNKSNNPLNFDRTRLQDETIPAPGQRVARDTNPGDRSRTDSHVREDKTGLARLIHTQVVTAANTALAHTISGTAGVHAHKAIQASNAFSEAVAGGKISQIKAAGDALHGHLTNMVNATTDHLNALRPAGANNIMGTIHKNVEGARAGIDLYKSGGH